MPIKCLSLQKFGVAFFVLQGSVVCLETEGGSSCKELKVHRRYNNKVRGGWRKGREGGKVGGGAGRNQEGEQQVGNDEGWVELQGAEGSQDQQVESVGWERRGERDGRREGDEGPQG